MKRANPIEKSQRLEEEKEYFKEKYQEVKKENIELRREIEILKKNLANF